MNIKTILFVIYIIFFNISCKSFFAMLKEGKIAIIDATHYSSRELKSQRKALSQKCDVVKMRMAVKKTVETGWSVDYHSNDKEQAEKEKALMQFAVVAKSLKATTIFLTSYTYESKSPSGEIIYSMSPTAHGDVFSCPLNIEYSRHSNFKKIYYK